MSQAIKIDDELKGMRADVAATKVLPTISRAYIHKLFEAGQITVNNVKEKPGYKLRFGDSLTVSFDPAELGLIESIDLPIIYEDNDVLVVDKPAGVISHARGKFWNEPSVASFIRQKTGQAGDRAGIVHRLDRVTSGVMICAKNHETLSFLQKQFSERKVKKSYIAVTAGHLKQDKAIIDMPVARNPAKPQTFKADPNGKTAQTEYKVEKSSKDYDMVRLEPKTGRTHQIRVHLKEIGHPILGDQLYGGAAADRLYLHAVSLEIKLPTGKKMTFASRLPNEFEKVMAQNE